MFFLLSKLLSFVFSPVFWLALLLGWAWRTRRPRRRYGLLIGSFMLAFVATNAALVDKAMRAWEMPPSRVETIRPHDAGILLTGLGDGRKRPVAFSSADGLAPSRVAGIWQLYRLGLIQTVIISGGSGDLVGKSHVSEARHLAHLLQKAGVPATRIILEERSRNTHENALFTSQLVSKRPELLSLVLVTSAYHQRRALGCFQRVGLQPTPFPTDFRATTQQHELRHWVVPSLRALKRWHLLLHEIAGYLAYKVLGYC